MQASVEAIQDVIGGFAGTPYFVDPNHPNAADAHTGLNPAAPLRTVGMAATKILPQRGDVIIVGANDAWYYAPGGSGVSADYGAVISEEVVIPYTASGVRIVGLSHGTLGVMWTPASNAGTCITVHAIDAIIEGFVFTEGISYVGLDAISCEWDQVTMFGENLIVRNCTFDDTVDIAIQLEFSWYCNIYNNVFWECDEYGVYVDAVGSGISYAQIYDNKFHDCGTAAIALLGGSDENHIYRNAIFNANAQGGGLATNEGINTTGGVRNMVYDNYLSCLLPVPANGDLNDFCTAAATDAWIGNHCMNGLQVTNPT